jgi:predicted transcriptional regulator
MPKKIIKSSVPKSRDIKKLLMFLEELSWLMTTYSDMDFKSISNLIKNRIEEDFEAKAAVGGYISSNPNKHFLVGVLPRLFNDSSLFPTNEDIAQFALKVMDLKISRFHKISKYEIIGHIVCQTESLDDKKLSKVVSALAKLAEDDEKTKNLIKKRKEENFDWNAIIQEIAAGQIND